MATLQNAMTCRWHKLDLHGLVTGHLNPNAPYRPRQGRVDVGSREELDAVRLRSRLDSFFNCTLTKALAFNSICDAAGRRRVSAYRS